MTNNIVIVNVSQTVAPAPSQLQRTGALISQGGTTKAAQTLTLLTSLADLTAILSASKAISTDNSWSTEMASGLRSMTEIRSWDSPRRCPRFACDNPRSLRRRRSMGPSCPEVETGDGPMTMQIFQKTNKRSIFSIKNISMIFS